MKLLLAALLMLAVNAARADLYRWIDPQSGSVKYSSVPPPSSQAGVQVIPYRANAAPPAKPDAPAPAPALPGNDALELRWRGLLAEISAAAPGSPELQPRLNDLAAVATELDRVDPAGSQRRRAQAQAVLQRFFKVEQ